MSNTQKIKEIKSKIEKLKKGLTAKTSASLKAKAKTQIGKYQAEIKSLESKGKKTPATKGSSAAEKAKQISLKMRKNQGLSTSKSDVEKDAGRPALKSGKRMSKYGNEYYEYRENRIDRRPQKYARLADGGMMAKGGSLESIKRKYEINEDENAHSENVVLLAKHFGSADELKQAKEILAKHSSLKYNLTCQFPAGVSSLIFSALNVSFFGKIA